MWIIGCDFHPRYQQVAALNQESGEIVERRLSHEGKEVVEFYESSPREALIGMEATCPAQWFERLLDRCGHRLWVGDPAKIRAAVAVARKLAVKLYWRLRQLEPNAGAPPAPMQGSSVSGLVKAVRSPSV